MPQGLLPLPACPCDRGGRRGCPSPPATPTNRPHEVGPSPLAYILIPVPWAKVTSVQHGDLCFFGRPPGGSRGGPPGAEGVLEQRPADGFQRKAPKKIGIALRRPDFWWVSAPLWGSHAGLGGGPGDLKRKLDVQRKGRTTTVKVDDYRGNNKGVFRSHHSTSDIANGTHSKSLPQTLFLEPKMAGFMW